MTEKIKLLLAEDELVDADIYTEKFNMKGFICRTATNVFAAVKTVEDGFSPEVAIIDALLPEGGTRMIETESYGLAGGLLVCNWLVKNYSSRCRTIMWCGLGGFRWQAQRAGAWAYVVKPTHLEYIPELWEAINRGALLPSEMGKPTRKFSRKDEKLPD